MLHPRLLNPRALYQYSGRNSVECSDGLPLILSPYAFSFLAQMSTPSLLVSDSSLVIAPATSKDYKQIEALNLRAYGELEDALSARAWQRLINDLSDVSFQARSAHFWVIRSDSDLVGSIAYAAPGMSDSGLVPPSWAAFLSLAVDPAWRRQGIATQLVQSCIDLAKQDGAPAIGLFTSDLMLPAQRLYRSLGFTRHADLGIINTMRYWRYGKAL